MTVLPNSMFSGFPGPVADPICRRHASHARGTWPSFDSINPIDLFSYWLGLRVSLNSDGGIPTGRSNSLHDHHSKNTKPIKTLIYICISPYAHILNLKLSSYGSGTTEGIRGGYVSTNKNFPCKTGTAAVRDHGITTRRADAAESSRCRRTRRGSR
jgi:hypothetical protein